MLYNFRKRSDDARIFNEETSMTDESFQKQCDINVILNKYSKNGINPFVITQDALYGDFSNMPKTYTEAFNIVEAAEDHFAQLPAKLRERFGYDPVQMLHFLNDPKNLAEARDLGLVATEVPTHEIVQPGSSQVPSSPSQGSDAG